MISIEKEVPSRSSVGTVTPHAVLTSLLPSLLRAASSQGTAAVTFDDYELSARSESLGAVLVAVSWTLKHRGHTVARDALVQPREKTW